MGPGRVERPLETEDVVSRRRGRRKVRADLQHADARNLVEDTESLQDRQVHRQQRLADVESRVTVLFQQRHRPALAGKNGGGGAAGGAAAHDYYVALRRGGAAGVLLAV